MQLQEAGGGGAIQATLSCSLSLKNKGTARIIRKCGPGLLCSEQDILLAADYLPSDTIRDIKGLGTEASNGNCQARPHPPLNTPPVGRCPQVGPEQGEGARCQGEDPISPRPSAEILFYSQGAVTQLMPNARLSSMSPPPPSNSVSSTGASVSLHSLSSSPGSGSSSSSYCLRSLALFCLRTILF